MSRIFGVVIVAACLVLLGEAATVAEVKVSQNWPWSRFIVVDYTLAEVTAPVHVRFHAYDGSKDLGDVPEVALAGPRQAVTGTGPHRVTIDPARCAFANVGTMKRFKIAAAAEPSTLREGDEVLYRVVELKSGGTQTEITRKDILDRQYGDYETQPSWLGRDVCTTLGAANLFLTGITNDASWVTDRLLLRKIKAGTYRVGTKGTAYPVHETTLTRDCWIGVFEISFAQWNRVMGDMLGDAYPTCPAQGGRAVTYDTLRGAAAENPAYDWPKGRAVSPDSFMGRLRALTGLAFDLPTEEQWAIAAYAGAVGAKYYDGSSSNVNDERNLAVRFGRCAINSQTTGFPCGRSQTALPGRYLPNGYGLYDMLGNVRELVLDWYVADNVAPGAKLIDWEGAASGTHRGVKGGCAGHSLNGGMTLNGRFSADILPGVSAPNTGFRVCLVLP